MRLSRRDFLKLASVFGITTALPIEFISKALAGNALPRVIWLQGLSCSGCSVSLLNSVASATCPTCPTIDDLLINSINLEYHSTLIAAAGDVAMAAAMGPHPSVGELSAFTEQWLSEGIGLDFDISGPSGSPDLRVNWIDFAALCQQGYILVVEGAIPFGSEGKFCSVGGEMTMIQAFSQLASKSNMIIAAGTCASFGGIPAAGSNPTGAVGVTSAMSNLGISKPVIKIPGCPMHPEWFVATVIKILSGLPVDLDSFGRPKDIFGDSSITTNRIHAKCPYKNSGDATQLGQTGCMEDLGCRGKSTWANCPTLKWNNGVNWCVGARTPCHGCTESNFPGGAFYSLT
jgi:hydrogenase small subunit